MRGRVLITRPEVDANNFAEDIRQKGYEVSCEAFLNVIYDDISIPDLSQYSSLIFTSINGVRAFCQNTKDRILPVLTVGDKTQVEVRASGFEQTKSASGNVDDLIALLSKEQAEKPYLYCRGEHISRPLKEVVTGVSIEEIILYHTEKQQKISSGCAEIIKAGGFSHVLFFSKRTAESFVDCVLNHQDKEALESGLKSSKALCLGTSMIECVSILPWQEVRVASHSDSEGILALL